MKGKTVQFDSESHLAVQLLLPWYVIGRLGSAERVRVEAHLAECPRCCADVAWQRKLRIRQIGASVGREPPRRPAAPVLLLPPIKAEPPLRPPLPQRVQARTPAISWRRWMPVLQGLAVLGVALLLLLPRMPENDAQVPGATAAGANLIVVFRATSTEPQIRQALRETDAHVVDGPSASGVYLLKVAPEQRGAALQRLREEPAVARADTVGSWPVR